MDKMKRGKAVIGVIAVLLCGTVYLCANYHREPAGTAVTEDFTGGGESAGNTAPGSSDARGDSAGNTGTGNPDAEEEKASIYIHICGAVKKPGVYEFDREPRVIEVVKRAGGFTKKADRTSLNLASPVADGTQLVIASKSASKKGKNTSAGQDFSDQPQGDLAHSGQQGQSGPDSAGKININTASKEELMTLSGIGEAKADMILSYREEHGAFQKIEDIMNISGIKEGVFGQIKDSITV